MAADSVVYAGCSYDKRSMIAVALEGAAGDLTGTAHVLWSLKRHTPYIPSPLLYSGKLYFLKHYQGVLSCLEAKTGKSVYGPMRLPDIFNVYSSPVAANEKIYITSRQGVTVVLSAGAEPRLALSR